MILRPEIVTVCSLAKSAKLQVEIGEFGDEAEIIVWDNARVLVKPGRLYASEPATKFCPWTFEVLIGLEKHNEPLGWFPPDAAVLASGLSTILRSIAERLNDEAAEI